MVHKYRSKADFIIVEPNPRDSPFWKQVLKHRHIILDRLRWVVGDSVRIKISDTWIPWEEATPPLKASAIHNPKLVSDFIIHSSNGPTWNEMLLSELWEDYAVLNIMQILIWSVEPAWECSLKVIYKHLMQPPVGPHFPWHLLWKIQIPPKIKFFTWRILLNRIPIGMYALMPMILYHFEN